MLTPKVVQVVHTGTSPHSPLAPAGWITLASGGRKRQIAGQI